MPAPVVSLSSPPPPSECNNGIETEKINNTPTPIESSRTPDQPSRSFAGRHTSPSDSVVRDRAARRKISRTHGINSIGATNAPRLPTEEQITGRVSTSPQPQPKNTTPRQYRLPPVERNLRSKEFSGTFHLRNKPTSVPKYTAEEREKFIDQFTTEMNNQFTGRNPSTKQNVENAHLDRIFKRLMGAGSIYDDGIPGGIAEISCCSRYKVEDIIKQSPSVGSEERCPIILAVKSSIAKEKNSILKNSVRKKQKNFLGSWKNGCKRRFNNEEYTLFKCHLVANKDHDAINKCTMSYADFIAAYADGRGFDVHFENVEGECGRKHFEWKHLIEHPMEYMFFGPPLRATLTNHRLFEDAWDVNYIHHIFVQMASECWGDAYASAALLSAYLRKLVQEKERNSKTGEGFFKNLLTTLNFSGESVKTFFKQVNDTLKESILKSASTMQFYTEPIIDYKVITGWVEKAKEVFPKLWQILGSLRGISIGEGFSPENKLIQSKLNQILFQLFSLARMSNPKNLIWFSFVQAVANFGRGVPASAVNNFFGNVCSNRTRDRLLRNATHDVLKRQIGHLSTLRCLILVFDNYQKGQQLRNQREKHSSNFFKGTTQVALQGKEWIDEGWDQQYKKELAKINYNNDLVIPSAPDMPKLEEFHGRECKLFADVKDDTIDKDDNPSWSGERVDCLAYFIIFALLLGHVQRVFGPEDIPFVEDNFDQEKISKFRDVTKKAHDLFKAAKMFPTQIVKCWNKFWAERTPSLFLGLVGIADEKSMETGVLAGDLLVKSGIIINKGNGVFELAPDYKEKRHIMVGDAKSVENIMKFLREVSGREFSLQQSSAMLQVFLDGLAQVMIIPGDWHAGLAMLQAIYSLWWPLLLPFKEQLGWKRVNKDVRNCYFQAVRLLEFVANELMRVLLFGFVSKYPDTDVEVGKEDEYICKCVKEFYAHIKELAFQDNCDGADDQWRKSWAIFIIMVLDFKSFTEAYRNGDALMIEYGYKRFAPVWEMLGQHKYVARHWDQAETLYRGDTFSFARLMECRINRCVRRYEPGKEGKRMTAHDENLENWNGFYARFPMVRTLAAFVRQGPHVGLARRCILFVDKFFRIQSDDKANSLTVPTSAKESKTKNEKQLVFEMFVKSNTHKAIPGRKANASCLSDINITTDLKHDGRVDARTKETDTRRDLGSLNILSVVQSGYTQHVLVQQDVVDEIQDGGREEEEEIVDEILVGTTQTATSNDEDEEASDAERQDVGVDNDDWDNNAVDQAREENATNGLPLPLQNLWKKGNEKFIAQEVGATRETKANRAKVHLELQKEVFKRAEARRQETQRIVIGTETNSPPSTVIEATKAFALKLKISPSNDSE